MHAEQDPSPDAAPAAARKAGGLRSAAAWIAALPLVVLLVAWGLAPGYCALGWERHYEGELETVRAQANGVARWVEADLDREVFATGSSLFDGEWWFGTYMMAGLGYAQTALEHPELRARHTELAKRCVARLLDPRVKAFDARSWKEDPIESLDGDNGHVAYLGYLNVVLGLLRQLEPDNEYAALNDRISQALERRFAKSSFGLIETYPNEIYPIDNASGIASLALHAKATGKAPSPEIAQWVERIRARYLDPTTGLLIQSVVASSGEPLDAPRGSGSGLAAVFLAYADPQLSRDLYQAISNHLSEGFLGFGVVKEYPPGVPGGGDIDSGPLILGYSVSATGFQLGACRIHQDPEQFARIYGTAWLFGAPTLQEGERLQFAAGGPLGDALMFALMTAPRLPPPAKEDRQ